ncbi:MAG: hypothetical protein KDE21_12785 [Novosphingobium sp.]|nr:hypothetical protein [Novosphingobium sp.]
MIVSDLKSDGCELVAVSGQLSAHTGFSLWIGAIGPLAISLVGQAGKVFHARFDERLDKRIVDHFSCAAAPGWEHVIEDRIAASDSRHPASIGASHGESASRTRSWEEEHRISVRNQEAHTIPG